MNQEQCYVKRQPLLLALLENIDGKNKQKEKKQQQQKKDKKRITRIKIPIEQ